MASTGSLTHARQALDALTALQQHTVHRRPLTDVDRDALRLWPGWGPLAPAFEASPEGQWAHVANALDDLLAHNPAALDRAADVCDTAFYTADHVIDTVYGLLRSAGLTAGHVLEPGCGSGRFMSRTPVDMDLTWTGVEIDPTSAQIAALLHPDAEIINRPLEKVTFRTGQFDAAIGNVPFSSSHVFDPAYPSGSLHEYFLLRAVDAVRPGGYVALITSRFTLDTPSGLQRVLAHADLHAAVRLPAAAFTSEGASVVTDILLLQRRADGQPLSGWNDTAENTETITRTDYSHWSQRATTVTRPRRLAITEPATPGQGYLRPVEVNRYWEAHPDHVAGQMRVTGHYRNPLTVLSDHPVEDIAKAAAAAAAHLPPITPRPGPVAPVVDAPLTDAEGRKEGSFHLLDDGTVHRVTDGTLTPVRATAELKALIGLRDAALDLLAAEADQQRPDHQITPLREAARSRYEAYVNRWGPLNRGTLHEGKTDPDTGMPSLSWRRPTMGGFRRDPDYVTVLALEDYDQDTGQASPAPILLRRVNRAPDPIERVATPGEALSVALGEGTLDLARVASLLDLDTAEEAATALGDLVYADPDLDGAWVTARDYLSGNVRDKLATARHAAETDPSYARNVTALAAVLPTDLDEHDIKVSLGAPWITTTDIEAFLADVLGQRVAVTHTPVVAYWELDRRWIKPSAEAAMLYGTSRMDPYALVEHALNGKAPVVWDEEWDPTTRTTKKVRNQAETLAAEEKVAALAERFATWIWEDGPRAECIKTEYNRRFNSHVTRRHDGSHLTFPGLADGIDLWPWQRDIVDRIVSSPRTLCGHAVGSGKTRSMICAALTLRRFGLANKPLIVVPNHLLEQIAREAQQAYPLGKFLIATKDDLAKDQRRLFAARCATGDWDAVVMTHQAFTSLPVNPDVEAEWLETQKADLRAHLQDIGSESGRGAKQVARMLRSFEARISDLRHNTADEDTVLFEHLGVDFIAVDECQAFKRLGFATRAEGFSLGSSKRATDLLLKIDTLGARNPDRPHVAFFTGTPWSNTLAETYVWQRYLQPERLEAAGVDPFDAWAASFVRYETRVEVTPDGGGFRLHRRPSAIQNAADLFTGMFAHVADLLPADAINLQRPDSTVHNITVDPTPRQQAYVSHLSKRADKIRNGGNTSDNMLVVCGDGRKVALDPRLVGLPDDSPKVTEAAARVAAIYNATKDTTYGTHPRPGALQLLLCDLGTPQTGDTQTYGRLRAALAAHGVPADKIRWVHEAKTDKARAALFAACRDGDVAVLLGSTEKVGIGTNIQTRLVALHHVDAPWRPSDLEQRDGRALRPGNLNPHVDIYRYVATGTFDAYMWQTLERKARFIAQAFQADGPVREIEDLGDMVLSYGEVKALATGNPHLLEQATLAAEVKRLRTLRALHQRSVNDARRRADDSSASADRLQRVADALEAAIATAETTEPNDRETAALERFAVDLRHGRGYGTTWRGLELRADSPAYGQQRRRGAPVEIRIAVNYREAGTIEVTRKALRQAAPQAAAALVDELTDWLTEAPHRLNRLRAAVDAARRDAADARQVADTSTFTQADALTDAERRLSAVEAAIAREAADSRGAAA